MQFTLTQLTTSSALFLELRTALRSASKTTLTFRRPQMIRIRINPRIHLVVVPVTAQRGM